MSVESTAAMGTALVVPEPGDDATVRNLKRPSLLFGRIAVWHFSGFVALLEKTGADPQCLAELQWLKDRGVVSPLNADGPRYTFMTDFFQEAADHFPRIVPDALNYASWMTLNALKVLRISKWIGADGVLVCAKPPGGLLPATAQGHDLRRADVIQVVFSAFPEPHANTPWEQILEFRSDPESAAHVLALKRWIGKISREPLAPGEIAEEIEWLIHEYEAHMLLHRMKTCAGMLESIVIAAAEAIENVAKLRLGLLAKSAFALRHRKIHLLEAERQAPGRELAYVIRARERFPS